MLMLNQKARRVKLRRRVRCLGTTPTGPVCYHGRGSHPIRDTVAVGEDF